MVTPIEMRLFARDCLRWADQTDNASNRELVLRISRSWMEAASAIDRRVAEGAELANPDLRTKLD
jgi:hypothetical protein